MTTRHAVVTGAAGGMGRAIVARLIADGHRVTGIDLSADGLAEVAAEHGDALRLQIIGKPGHQRRLGTDDDKPDLLVLAKVRQQMIVHRQSLPR